MELNNSMISSSALGQSCSPGTSGHVLFFMIAEGGSSWYLGVKSLKMLLNNVYPLIHNKLSGPKWDRMRNSSLNGTHRANGPLEGFQPDCFWESHSEGMFVNRVSSVRGRIEGEHDQKQKILCGGASQRVEPSQSVPCGWGALELDCNPGHVTEKPTSLSLSFLICKIG